MATISRSTPSPKLMRVVNPLVTFLVGRGRGAVAQRLMVVHWTGRITGNQYSTPVSRHEVDGQLLAFTRAGYKHNFVGGGPAEIVLDGERRPFMGTAVDDPDRVAARMHAMLDDLGPKHGPRALGLKIEGDPTIDDLTAFVARDGVVILEFDPA